MVLCSLAWRTELCVCFTLLHFNTVSGSQFVVIAAGSCLVCYLIGSWCCFFVKVLRIDAEIFVSKCNFYMLSILKFVFVLYYFVYNRVFTNALLVSYLSLTCFIG